MKIKETKERANLIFEAANTIQVDHMEMALMYNKDDQHLWAMNLFGELQDLLGYVPDDVLKKYTK